MAKAPRTYGTLSSLGTMPSRKAAPKKRATASSQHPHRNLGAYLHKPKKAR